MKTGLFSHRRFLKCVGWFIDALAIIISAVLSGLTAFGCIFVHDWWCGFWKIDSSWGWFGRVALTIIMFLTLLYSRHFYLYSAKHKFKLLREYGFLKPKVSTVKKKKRIQPELNGHHEHREQKS